jgi:CRP/FNR family transcriptional regulator/CRP/FNR family cyclic AMP-dependent transcriptional regulator
MEANAEVVEALHRSLLVYGLSPEQIQPIAALGKKENFVAGEYLTIIGAREADLFVLIEGHVNVLTHDGDKLGEIGPGGILGEIAFVDAGPRHAHAVAQGFVTAVKFPAKELRAQLSKDRNAGFLVLANLARLIAARLRNADGRLDSLMDLEHDVWHHAL